MSHGAVKKIYLIFNLFKIEFKLYNLYQVIITYFAFLFFGTKSLKSSEYCMLKTYLNSHQPHFKHSMAQCGQFSSKATYRRTSPTFGLLVPCVIKFPFLKKGQLGWCCVFLLTEYILNIKPYGLSGKA